MTSYYEQYPGTPHQSRHYESCLNSNCSRSPSPVRRQLWEPKHPPQKLKNNKKLPLKAVDTTTQSSSYTRSRDKSPFLAPRDFNRANTPRRYQDPLFTYTINEGSIDNYNGTKSIEVNIGKQLDSSFPYSGRDTSEPCVSSNPTSKVELELDTSSVPPIVTIKNNNTISSQTLQATQFRATTPSTTCTQSCPYSSSPKSSNKYDLCCNCCAHCHVCSGSCCPQQTAKSQDSVCQPCHCPTHSTPLNSRQDKATSPIKPFSTPQELEPTSPAWRPYCPCSSSPRYKEDKALSPIDPSSRSPSPPLEDLSPKSIYGRSNRSSDIGSEGSVEIKVDQASQVDIDWEGDVGPINVNFPISSPRNQHRRFEDQVHSHDPQLEAFYTSSYNQSGSPSSLKSKTSSPSSPRLGRQNSSSTISGPPWNSCHHIDRDCFNEAKSSSISRSPYTPSTNFSTRPQSKELSRRVLTQNNYSNGSHEIYGEDIDTTSTHDFTRRPFSTPKRLDQRIEDQQSNSLDQPPSPFLTLTPRSNGNGHMTIEWRDPRSIHEKRSKKIDPLFLQGKSPKRDYDDVGPSSYYQEEEAKENKELSHRPIVKVRIDATSSNTNLESKTAKQAKDFSRTASSCKSPCISSPCTPPCAPCQGDASCLDSCCYIQDHCVAPVEGINKCTSLPPHLQSDWSASLRCPPNQVRTKPILYRDSQGHEHIMFADGSIEHLNHHSNPTNASPTRPRKTPPTPPLTRDSSKCPPLQHCYCQPAFHGGESKFDNHGATNFSPKCGDIVIRARQRLPCMYPGKDNGQVVFFTSDYLDLQEGDAIVRLGKFDNFGRWCSSKLVEMYLRGSHGRWTFLGTTNGHPGLYPLEADRHQVVRTPNKELNMKLGDLVISTSPSPNSFYFWNPKTKLDNDRSYLLLRAYIGQPQIVDENHNLACCGMGHLPVGYVELYVKVKRIWLFLGRDEQMFTEHELKYFS